MFEQMWKFDDTVLMLQRFHRIRMQAHVQDLFCSPPKEVLQLLMATPRMDIEDYEWNVHNKHGDLPMATLSG
jgi:hypothetical protein